MNWSHTLRAAAAAALLAECALPLRAPAVERIPFTDAGGAVRVQASVDGRPPVAMTIDLSAGIDELGPGLASLAYDVNRFYAGLRTNGERIDERVGRVVSLSVGGDALENTEVALARTPLAGGADGTLSAMAFRTLATTFDFPNHQLVVEDAASFADRRRTALSVPLVMQQDRGLALRYFAWFDFAGRPGLCAIDTAAPGITLDRRFAAAAGVSGPSIAKVSLHDAPAVAVRDAAVATGDLVYDCDVGTAFWLGRTATFDAPNGVLWVSTPT